jgi:hypothetical protein
MLELIDRLSICSQIEETFRRNENLRPKSRLDTTSSTLDHSSIRDWSGNLVIDSSNFKLIWKMGNERAKDQLKKYGFSTKELEGPFGTASMLSPFDIDETQGELTVSTQIISQSQIHEELETQVLTELDTIIENPNNSYQSISDSESEDDNEELNDYLEDFDDQNQSKVNSHIQREDGTFQHKANAINSYLNNKTKASTDRILRVRKRVENDEEDLNYDLINDENRITLNDRLITLVKSKSSLMVVIFIISGITKAGESLFLISKSEMNQCIFKGHILEFTKLENDKYIWSGEYVGFINKIGGNLCIEFETQVFIRLILLLNIFDKIFINY